MLTCGPWLSLLVGLSLLQGLSLLSTRRGRTGTAADMKDFDGVERSVDKLWTSNTVLRNVPQSLHPNRRGGAEPDSTGFVVRATSLIPGVCSSRRHSSSCRSGSPTPLCTLPAPPRVAAAGWGGMHSPPCSPCRCQPSVTVSQSYLLCKAFHLGRQAGIRRQSSRHRRRRHRRRHRRPGGRKRGKRGMHSCKEGGARSTTRAYAWREVTQSWARPVSRRHSRSGAGRRTRGWSQKSRTRPSSSWQRGALSSPLFADCRVLI